MCLVLMLLVVLCSSWFRNRLLFILILWWMCYMDSLIFLVLSVFFYVSMC